MARGRDGDAEGGAEEEEERGGEGPREAGVGDEEEGVRAWVPDGEVASDGGERVRREDAAEREAVAVVGLEEVGQRLVGRREAERWAGTRWTHLAVT